MVWHSDGPKKKRQKKRSRSNAKRMPACTENKTTANKTNWARLAAGYCLFSSPGRKHAVLNDHGLDLDSGSSTFTSTENVSQPCLAEENVFATFAMETPLVLQKLALQTKRTCDTCSQQQDTAVPGEHKDIYRSNKNTSNQIKEAEEHMQLWVSASLTGIWDPNCINSQCETRS